LLHVKNFLWRNVKIIVDKQICLQNLCVYICDEFGFNDDCACEALAALCYTDEVIATQGTMP